MNPQHFSVPPGQSLATALAMEMARLAESGQTASPALVVDSPLAAQAVKSVLASTGWPGRAQGEPLPWCGTLDQAMEAMADRLAVQASVERPRPMALRRVRLAQQLLDHRGIADSLGGSPRAALNLAAKWVEIFDGWEWLEMQAIEAMQATTPTTIAETAPHLAKDLGLLRELHQHNRVALDRASWAAQHATAMAPEVWFCMSRSPSPKEMAMASLIWKVPTTALRVWSTPPIDSLQVLRERLQWTSEQSPRCLIAAQTLEESAWAAVQTILAWRAQGIDDIGVVALDRKMLRRLRALLERAGEPLADRSGWALDTTVAASAVVGLNDLLTQQATTQSVLEWIHSPFVTQGLALQCGLQHDDRRRLDAALRAYGRITPVTLKELVDQKLLPLADLLPGLQSAQARLSVADWSGQLLHAIELTGLDATLSNDVAGQAVLAALQALQADALLDSSPIASSLWHALLNESLAQSRFVEPVENACVRVCSLSSLSWKTPSALVVLGADAQRLPPQAVPEFFEPKRFAEMGLINTLECTLAEGFGQFAALWADRLALTLIACAEKPDSQVEFSSWIELLAMATPESVVRTTASAIIERYVLQVKPAVPAPAALTPTVFDGQLPPTISVTEIQKLIDCPYQFYLQTLLGLAPMEPLQEDSPPSDLGSLIHQVLAGATMQHGTAEDWSRWLTDRMDERLGQPFFVRRRGELASLSVPPAIKAKLRADAMALVPALSEWLLNRSRNPATASATTLTEETVSRTLADMGVAIKGRIDRWEKNADASVLIDFKTSDPDLLKKNVKPGDRDVQLPLYAWLIAPGHTATDARYVSVRREAIQEIGLEQTTGQPVAQLTESVVGQVRAALRSIASGEPLALLGMTRDPQICERCNVRGICRRDELIVRVDSEEGEATP